MKEKIPPGANIFCVDMYLIMCKNVAIFQVEIHQHFKRKVNIYTLVKISSRIYKTKAF